MSKSAITIDRGFITRQLGFAKAHALVGEIKLWERMLEQELELQVEKGIPWEGLSYDPIA